MTTTYLVYAQDAHGAWLDVDARREGYPKQIDGAGMGTVHTPRREPEMATSSETKAKAALVQALLQKDAFDGKALEITWPHDRETVKALIVLMSDVTTEDWAATPMEGRAYRQYSGKLPCGLRLDVVTNVEDVAPIDCTTP